MAAGALRLPRRLPTALAYDPFSHTSVLSVESLPTCGSAEQRTRACKPPPPRQLQQPRLHAVAELPRPRRCLLSSVSQEVQRRGRPLRAWRSMLLVRLREALRAVAQAASASLPCLMFRSAR